MNFEIRNATGADIDGIKRVLDSTGLFPAEALDEMIMPYINDSNCPDIWFVCTVEECIAAFGYCVPEKLTDGTCNLLAIAVSNNSLRSGIGQQMMKYIENRLLLDSKRILIVDTSSDLSYEKARRFYEKIGYQKIATINDFWREGEDKVIYYKKLLEN